MLIVFGTKVRTKVLQAIVFACTNCHADRPGAVVQLRRWFTLFWIPVIPLNRLGEVVRCDHCKGTFRREILDRPTATSVNETHTNAVRALGALLVGAGDPADPELRARAVATIGSVVPGYADETLTTDLQALDPAYAGQYVVPLGETYDASAKERFLGDLVRVAASGSEPSPGQRAMLDEVGRALGLSPAHVAGIVATASNPTGPGWIPTSGATWPPRPTSTGGA